MTCRIILILILIVAASLRFYRPGDSPPGMNVDEAAAIWNSYSLVRTGMDQYGVRWPIFHTRFFGEDDPSTLFLYYLMPFMAAFGLSVSTARIAAAAAGVMGIILMYYCGSRLFGRATGLMGALLLTFNPWHLFLSRSGHEGILTPLLLLIPLAAMLWANLPFDSSAGRPPRPFRAAVAGLLTGLCCYGYPSIRIFLPLFFTAAILLSWKEWRRRFRDRAWALAMLLMLFSAAALYLPLIWVHVTDPAMLRRAGTQWVWAANDAFGQKIVKTIQRYPPHFGLPFLFESGDRYPALTPPAGYGEFLWFMFPLMLAGMIILIKSYRTSVSARTLAALVLLYPAGDLLNRHPSPHAFRAAPGIVALVMLAAFGAVWIARWLFSRDRMLMIAAVGLGLVTASVSTIVFLHAFFQSYNREAHIYHSYAVDLIEALDWLRPRLDNIDVVFCTTGSAPHPYIYSLVRLGYEPAQWFNDRPEISKIPTRNTIEPYEDVTHFGKMYFFYGGSVNATIQSLYLNQRVDHAVFIVKPGELPSVDESAKPSLEIRDPQGNVSLLIYEMNL
jgi:4-amino-4-deoxy-L-arabinose transferase-like glycosyltransferase